MMSTDSTAPGEGKRALLARLLTERARAPRTHPASFGQQRLWFLDRFAGGTAVYHIPVAFHLRGTVDEAALRTALAAVVARHDVLRTTFAESGGEVVQVVHPSSAVRLEIVDAAGGTRAEGRRLAAEFGRRPFDLAAGPLLRAALIRLGPDEHVLTLVLHHIVSDAWSLGVLFTDLNAAYTAARDGRDPRLPPLPVQYADFARWQREQLGGDLLTGQLDFWLDHLRGAPALLTLPTDRHRPAVREHRGAVHYLTLAPALVDRVTAFNRAAGVTMFMTLLAVFQTVLARHAGQDDVVIGTPVAGRGHPDLEGLAGFFVNTVALRLSSAGRPSLRELAARAREVTLNGLGNADLPFERLVEELQPERSLAHTPVFQAQLILQNAPQAPFRLGDTAATSLELDTGTAKFDLTLVGEATGSGGLRLAVEYDTDLFDASTIDRLTRHLSTLLTAGVAAPDRPLHLIPLLSGAERWEVLTGWNDTDRGTPPDGSVLDLVDPAAGATITGPDGTLDTAALLDRAGRIAARLRDAGVTADSPVGLCLSRGTGMLAAVLGVWWAGAGYLPLDPDLPADRLRYMLTDSGARVVLTDAAVAARLGPVLATAPTVLVDRDDPAAVPERQPVHPDGLAYLIYTSGSTGRPKGVAVPHRAVVNLVASFHDDLDLGAGDVFAAVTTLSFDISVLELLVPLVRGIPLEIVGAAEAGDGAALRARLESSGATAMQATPATWRLLLAAGGVPDRVRLRLCGGEALPRDLADRLLTADARLWNCYGPTETTVWSAAGPVPPSPAPIGLGAPIANTRVYVLDEALQPVPAGVVGEIYIGGTGVVRGYHGRAGLTARRFLPDPYADTPGARLYATGDLGRRRADGRLEFLGRGDHQIKVRGFRIEPGEIEAVLRADPRVADAVVGAWTGGDGDTRLAGHVVAADGTDPATLPELLRPVLAARLPGYMVPSHLDVLPALPLNANGKVDRGALPAPRWGDRRAPAVAPRTPVEQVLAGIWRDVLRGGPVGAHDDFFRLGGHSLLGAQVVARTSDTFGITVPIRVLFEAPTVAAMASALTAFEPQPGHLHAVAAVRLEVAGLSDEELHRMLEERA
ncbi:amino acid adenylation domain-containing protein [Catenuloplanes sp. NPDC020197]|nr:amino acid adenylation domain-containing protein [Catenuloplanes niger]